jgi:hypothetical protein
MHLTRERAQINRRYMIKAGKNGYPGSDKNKTSNKWRACAGGVQIRTHEFSFQHAKSNVLKG